MALALVRIAGTGEQLRGLTDIEELHLAAGSSQRTGPDQWEVFAYASAAAQAEIEGRGPTVEVVQSETEVEVQLASAYEGIDDSPVA